MTDLTTRIGNLPTPPTGDKELLARLFRLQDQLRNPPRSRECSLRFHYVWYTKELGRRGYEGAERVAMEWYNKRFNL